MPGFREKASPDFTAEELENSFPLDQGRRFNQGAGQELFDLVAEGMIERELRQRKRTARAEKAWRASIEVLLVNLVAAVRNTFDPDRFVAVSFNRNDYNFSGLSLDALKACRDYMRQEGLIEIVGGFRRPDVFGDTHLGRRTRLRATEKLRGIIERLNLGRRPLTIPAALLIRMKQRAEGVGSAPEDIEVSRAIIEAVNRRLAMTEIDLDSAAASMLDSKSVEDEGEEKDVKERKRRYAGDHTAVALYRSFKGDWESGGRLYGGWWMSVPSATRPYILINGQRTVELDYKTLHPRLLYHKLGLPIPNDPYQIPEAHSPEMRALGKRTFNRLLNKDERDPAKRLRMRACPGDNKILPKGMRFADYLARLTRQLSLLEQWFGTGMGVKLQREDSDLALAVLKALEGQGIPVLPIHDSFIVEEIYEKQLHGAMTDAFYDRYGFVPEIRVTPPKSGGLSAPPPQSP